MSFWTILFGVCMSLIAAVCYGTHTSLLRMKPIRTSRLRISIFCTYAWIGKTVGTGILYLILLSIGETMDFTPLAFIFVILSLLGQFLLFTGTYQIGVSYSMVIANISSNIGAVICQIIVGQPVQNYWLMAIGLLMVIASAVALLLLDKILSYFGLLSSTTTTTSTNSNNSTAEDESEMTPLHEHDEPTNRHDFVAVTELSNKQILIGVCCTTVSGLFLSFMYLVTLYVNKNESGLKFFYSSTVAHLVCLPIPPLMIFCEPQIKRIDDGDISFPTETRIQPIQLIRSLVCMDDAQQIWHFKQTFLIAFVCGVVVAVANITAVVAFQTIDFVVVECIFNLMIAVSVICGIVFYEELRTAPEIITFLTLTMTLICGVSMALLGVYGF